MISLLTGLKVTTLHVNMFYRLEHNAKGGPHEIACLLS